MKRIDKEIFEVENRLRMREVTIRQTALQAKTHAVQSLKSPVAIGGAVTLGLLLAATLGRRRPRKESVSRETREPSRGLGLRALLMTGATWFIRSQFGGPVGLAQTVLHKIKSKSEGKGEGDGTSGQRESPAHDSRPAQFTR